jgi:hypothetical protein
VRETPGAAQEAVPRPTPGATEAVPRPTTGSPEGQG